MTDLAVLVTAGTGKSSRVLEQMLQEAEIPFVMTSRRGPSAALPDELKTKTVEFDMLEPSTYANPFEYKLRSNTKLNIMYLISPDSESPLPHLDAFIIYAVQRGIQMIIMMAGSVAEVTPNWVAEMSKNLDDKKVKFKVLRPTWFMENFLEPGFVNTLKSEGKIYTACGNGRIPFISVHDVAALAFALILSRNTLPEISTVLTGPQLFSYDEVAAQFSRTIGRDIRHCKLTPGELALRYMKEGVPEYIANHLAWIEDETAKGSEEKTILTVGSFCGQRPRRLEDWIAQNRDAWSA